MKIDDLTVGQAKELASMFAAHQPAASPWKIGTAYLIRTVTNYWTGRVVAVYADTLVLSEAAWIADTGRFHNALTTGSLSEVEPVPRDVIIGRGSIVDATEWPFALPKNQK